MQQVEYLKEDYLPGQMQVIIAIKAFSAASHIKRLSCDDLRSSCKS